MTLQTTRNVQYNQRAACPMKQSPTVGMQMLRWFRCFFPRAHRGYAQQSARVPGVPQTLVALARHYIAIPTGWRGTQQDEGSQAQARAEFEAMFSYSPTDDEKTLLWWAVDTILQRKALHSTAWPRVTSAFSFKAPQVPVTQHTSSALGRLYRYGLSCWASFRPRVRCIRPRSLCWCLQSSAG
jgi:hypothetical protein